MVKPTKSSELDSKDSNPMVGKKRKTRPKKRSRLAAQARSKAEPPAPKTTPPAGKGTSQRPSGPKRSSASAQDPPANRPKGTSQDNVTPRLRDHRGPHGTGNSGRDHPRPSLPARRSRSPRRHDGRRDNKTDDCTRKYGPPRPQGRYQIQSPGDCCRHEYRYSHASSCCSSQDDNHARGRLTAPRISGTDSGTTGTPAGPDRTYSPGEAVRPGTENDPSRSIRSRGKSLSH